MSVAFKADYANQQQKAALTALSQALTGPTGANDMSAGVLFTFQFENKTSSTPFNYDVSAILNRPGSGYPVALANGSNASGTVAPGTTTQVSIVSYSTDGDGTDQDADSYLFQIGAAPLVTINGETVCFWFFTSGVASPYQQIEICNNSQSTYTFTSTPTNTSVQMNCVNETTGIGVGLGGGTLEDSPMTNNIAIAVYN
jgi:hypothetical protein